MAFNDDLIAHFRKNRRVITEGPFTGREVLLLTATGAKSGARRTHPLVHTKDGDRSLPDHRAQGRRAVASLVVPQRPGASRGDRRGRRRLYDQHSAINPGFKDYERKTSRVIPAILLERLPGTSG